MFSVTAVNDAPVAAGETLTSVAEDSGQRTILFATLLANDSAGPANEAGQALKITAVANAVGGTVSLSGTNVLFTPAANFNGQASFQYTIRDDGTTNGAADFKSANATALFSVTAVNDAPTLSPITAKSVKEGGVLTFAVSATDIERDALTFSLDSAPAGAVIDAATGQFSWAAADGPAAADVTVRVTDAQGAYATASFGITIENVAPTLVISGAGTVTEGQPYTLGLSAVDPGQDRVNAWTIHWGDGTTQQVAGNPSSVVHLYSVAGAFSISATASDEDGTTSANLLRLIVGAAPPPKVIALTPTATGVLVRFDRVIDPTTLNLYGTENSGLGAADLSLTGNTTGLVKGSLVLDADGMGLRFIRSGGPLVADTYTLRLASGVTAFKDLAGRLLDGNGDGIGGDGFSATFGAATPGRSLSLPDFMRGPGQSVDLTAPSKGGFLPLYLSDGAGAKTIEFTLNYDPAKLSIQSLSAGANLAGAATIEQLPSATGVLKVRITSPSALAAGKVHLLNIRATVPTTAAYGSVDVLDLANVLVNGSAGLDDDALHVVGAFGDASGDAAYSALDGQLLQRVIVKLDTGFAAYPNVDPVVVGDIAGGGTLNSFDASFLAQEVSFLNGSGTLDRPEIPPIPLAPATQVAAPRMQASIGLAATPGNATLAPTAPIPTATGVPGLLALKPLATAPGNPSAPASVAQPTPPRPDPSAALTLAQGVEQPAPPSPPSSDAGVLHAATLLAKQAPPPAVASIAAAPLKPGTLAMVAPPVVKVPVVLPIIQLGATSASMAGWPVPAPTAAAWLKDYLTNAGQVTSPAANLGLRVTIPTVVPRSSQPVIEV